MIVPEQQNEECVHASDDEQRDRWDDAIGVLPRACQHLVMDKTTYTDTSCGRDNAIGAL